MGLLGTLLERIGLRHAPRVAPPRMVIARPMPKRAPVVAPQAATAPATAQSPVAPQPQPPAAAAPAAPAATAELTPEQEAARKHEIELANLCRAFQASILDARFQSIEIDGRFVDEVGAYIAKSHNDLALPPAAAFDVMRLINDTGYSVRKVAAAIACDPTLAGAVISIANSPLHRGEFEIDNVPTAVVRLGQKNLRLLLLDIALHSTRVKGKPFEAFSEALWKHSLLTAQLSHRIAELVHIEPDHAYMAGLFHDIGCFAVVGAARRLALRQERHISPQTLLAAIRRFGYDLNATIVARWRLPESVSLGVAHHREIGKAGDGSQIAAITALANELSRSVGAWVEQRDVDLPSHPAIELLRLDLGRLPDTNAILELALKVERVAQLG